MSYKKEYLYIPRASQIRQPWGAGTSARTEIKTRNKQIYHDYKNGESTALLSQKYFLSQKSIQKILHSHT